MNRARFQWIRSDFAMSISKRIANNILLNRVTIIMSATCSPQEMLAAGGPEWLAFMKFCKDDTGFDRFLSDLEQFVEGNLTYSLLFSKDFFDKAEIAGCSPSGKLVSNAFVRDLLNLHFGVKYKTNLVVASGINLEAASLNCGIPLNQFLGTRNKQTRFRASVSMVCAVLNYVLANAGHGLDWTGSHFDERIVPDEKFKANLKKVHTYMTSMCKSKVTNKDVFLAQHFDPTEFFLQSYTPRPRKTAIEVTEPSDHGPIVIEPRRSDRIPPNCNRPVEIYRIESRKAKLALLRERQKLRLINSKSKYGEYNKVKIWRTTFKSKNDQITKLKQKVEAMEEQYSELLSGKIVELDDKYKADIEKLQSVIASHEALLESKEAKISDLKSNYAKLKSEYDFEMDRSFRELDEISEKLNGQDIDSVLDGLKESFADEFPQVKMRETLKKINPIVMKTLAMLRISVGISLRKCVISLVLVGNHCFGQKWVLPNSKDFDNKSRGERCLPPTKDRNEIRTVKLHQEDKSKLQNTAPAISFIKSSIETLLEPASYGSIFTEVKNAIHGTIGVDHYVEHRQKYQTQNIITYTENSEGLKSVNYRCLGLTNVFDTSGGSTSKQLQRQIQLGAILSSPSADADDILNSLTTILKKLKFANTDAASNMKSAMSDLDKWRKEMTGSSEELIWLHCNAHLIPALDLGTEKALMAVEKVMDMKQAVCSDINKSFFKPADSIVFTIFYALASNVGPSAKNQEWSSKVQFHAFLKSKGEKINRFFDPLSSRFGKNIEMGMIIAYNFKYLTEFFERTYMPNKMFKVCEIYLTECPMLYEISISMALLYYHLLGPFKVACGAEVNFGFKNLTHAQLLVFYKKFVVTIDSLTSDPSPMLNLAALPVVLEFGLNSFPRAHLDIIDYVMQEIRENDSINLEMIKKILRLICEEYLIAIHRQAGQFYLDDDCLVGKLLDADPTALDGVPGVALPAEHSVANARKTYQMFKNASTRTHSNFQMINSAPFYRDFCSMSAQEIENFVRKLRKSDQIGIYKKFYTQMKEEEKQGLQKSLEILLKKRDVFAQKRTKLCAAVKEHDGPFLSPEEVDKFTLEFKDSSEQLLKVIKSEVKYQQVVINNRNLDADLFKGKHKDHATGKFVAVKVDKMISNLKELVSPTSDTVTFAQCNLNELGSKLEEHHKLLQTYPHRQSVHLQPCKDLTDPSADPVNLPSLVVEKANTGEFNEGQGIGEVVTFNDESTLYITAFFVGEQFDWYPGIVTKTIQSKSCVDCARLFGKPKKSDKDKKCFRVKFLVPTEDEMVFTMSDTTEYHIHPLQLLETPVIEYGTLLSGDLSLVYSVKNAKDIDASMKKNSFYIANQSASNSSKSSFDSHQDFGDKDSVENPQTRKRRKLT